MTEKETIQYQNLSRIQKDIVDSLKNLGFEYKRNSIYEKNGWGEIEVERFRSWSDVLKCIHEQIKEDERIRKYSEQRKLEQLFEFEQKPKGSKMLKAIMKDVEKFNQHFQDERMIEFYSHCEYIQRKFEMEEAFSESIHRLGIVREKPILHLNLKKKWFDLIASGEKKEEYREVKPFYDRIFSRSYSDIKIGGKYYRAEDVVVCFSNGYSKNRRQIFVELEDLIFGFGDPAFGAEENKAYYILKLGKVIQF